MKETTGKMQLRSEQMMERREAKSRRKGDGCEEQLFLSLCIVPLSDGSAPV